MTAFRAETEFVGWLRARVSSTVPRLKLGIGDDAAIVEVAQGRELVLKADMSIEGVHFTRRLHPARSVGHRALARSLSDVAALGGAPKFALVSLVIAKATTRAGMRECHAGML